jgi:hypothetical protein
MCTAFTRKVLTLVGPGGAVLENDVCVVVNFYDVESATPDCCKCDISELGFVENFVIILVLVYFVWRWE